MSARLQLLGWRSAAVAHSCRSSVRCSVRDADGTCQEKRRVEPNCSWTSFLLQQIYKPMSKDDLSAQEGLKET